MLYDLICMVPNHRISIIQNFQYHSSDKIEEPVQIVITNFINH